MAATVTDAPAATSETDQRKLLVGLIGSGIQRSLTPSMHEEEARHHGLRLHYQLIDLDRTGSGVEHLPALIAAVRRMRFDGLNITYPCKQAVIPLLDELSDEARAIGSVNTAVFRDGKAIGHNTDGSGWAWGFRRALRHSAIAHAVLRLGAKRLVVVDSDAQRAAALADALNTLYGADRVNADTDIASALRDASGLIHATPTGMDKLAGLPLPQNLLRADLWVSEIVYFPLDTALLKAARRAGCTTSDGGNMAVGQAVGAFKLFTGLDPGAARMHAHFRSLLRQSGTHRASLVLAPTSPLHDSVSCLCIRWSVDEPSRGCRARDKAEEQ